LLPISNMATNKLASLRYLALDRCFSNPGRKYYIEDLIEACNQAIYESTGSDDGVKKRQVYDDITFMESEQGYAVPLIRHRDGRKKFFRYEDTSFTIRKRSVNQAEVEQIAETLAILSRFKGMPQFEWLDEIKIRLESAFGMTSTTEACVSFQENPYLKGLRYFADLFAAISQKKTLDVSYQGFKQLEPVTLPFHPWYLKQYNNRWFVLGHNETFGDLSILALDRIQALEPATFPYLENKSHDFEEYFEDVIGVSFPEDQPVETVLLKIDHQLWPYIESKPLHGSQKVKSRTTDGVIVELKVFLNYELRATLFSYLKGIEVLEPESLRRDLIKDLNIGLAKYL
jgi:predicted DNA-binding transcriptional regulator YafY